MKIAIIVLLSIMAPLLGYSGEKPKDKKQPHTLQGLDFNSVALLIWDGKSLKLEYDGHYYELSHSEECGCVYRNEEEERD